MSNELSKALDELRPIFEEIARKNKDDADTFWNGLSYEDKCNAFHAVVERIVKGDIKDRGSYRYVLYDVFGFDMDMYTRGMDCGYMELHNAIVNGEDDGKDNG